MRHFKRKHFSNYLDIVEYTSDCERKILYRFYVGKLNVLSMMKNHLRFNNLEPLTKEEEIYYKLLWG